MQTFSLYNWILQKKLNLCKFENLFADSKSRAQALSNDVSFVIFGHQTLGLEGEVKLSPPPAYPGFQVPQQDRVKYRLLILQFSGSYCTKIFKPFSQFGPQIFIYSGRDMRQLIESSFNASL